MSHDRVRRVDVSNFSIEEADLLSKQIGEKIRQITESAVANANRLLHIYGLEAQMQIVIGEMGKLTKEKPVKSKVSRQRKPREPKRNL